MKKKISYNTIKKNQTLETTDEVICDKCKATKELIEEMSEDE